MPELPEVETIKNIIGSQIKDRKIIGVQILHDKVIAFPDKASFVFLLKNDCFTHLKRRGKFLIFHLHSGKRMALHLRMTGQIYVCRKEEPVEKHTHVIICLEDDTELRYVDVRRFGRIWLADNGNEIEKISGINKLGIEPFDPNLTIDYLEEKAASFSPKMIKELLLDQSVICGIGNIYADEILFEAKLFPGKKCRNLSEDDWRKLVMAIPKILHWGIDADRMTPEEYLKRRGKDYSNIEGLKSYGREGYPCKVCGSKMEKMMIKGRSSCYCPLCQKEEIISREDLLDIGLELSDSYKDMPFHDKNWVLVRHKGNKKAFLWTYILDGELCMNVKTDPEWRDFWRSTYEAVIPAYHQNKEHWNTVILNGSIPAKEIKRMIMESYDLTAPKKKSRG